MALAVSDLVNVTINLSPTAAAARSFGVLMIAGDSNVINGLERFRTYTTYSGVTADFGTSAPEALAAALYFGQSPQPSTLMIGRYLRTATSGFNQGAVLSASQQALSNFTGITNGGLVIQIDGTTKTLTGLNFSTVTNLNNVATVINTSLTGGTVAWTGSQFTVTSATTGTASSVGFATTASGTDMGPLLLLTAASAVLIPGYAAELPVDCVNALANKSPAWYGIVFA